MNITQEHKDSVRRFKDYYDNLPDSCSEVKKLSFAITKADPLALLLKPDASYADGIRIYLGADIIDGNMIPTVHVVAVDGVNDYGNQVAVKHPCPYNCSGVNLFQ